MKKYLVFFSFPCFFLVPMLFVYQENLFGAAQSSGEENDYHAPEVASVMRRSLYNCEQLLSQFNITIPVLLIDVDFLEAMDGNNCGISAENHPLKIGVDVKFLSITRILEDSRFEVLYFTNETKKDYLDFRSDPRRIVPKNFTTRRIGNFEISTNPKRFVGFWKRSKLIDCMNLHIPRAAKTVKMPAIPSAKVLARLRDELIESEMFPFLNGGTLLGWYRECSVIPHTLDMDISVFAEDFKMDFVEKLEKNLSSFAIKRKFGKINDSFELTVAPRKGHRIHIDVFLMYPGIEKENLTHHWVGGVAPDGTKYKYTYPIYDPWCAAELHGHIFWVTCTPNEKIVKEYGQLWYLDHDTSKYAWNKSGKNVKKNGKWTKEEMKEVYKVFKG